MGVFGTVKELFEAPTVSDRGNPAGESQGAYWCHDCGERVLDLDVSGDAAPACPECGEAMEFERSAPAGCAC